MGCINPKNTREGIISKSQNEVSRSSNLKSSPHLKGSNLSKYLRVLPSNVLHDSHQGTLSKSSSFHNPTLKPKPEKIPTLQDPSSLLNSSSGLRNDSTDLKDRSTSYLSLPLNWKSSLKEETPNTENSQTKFLNLESRFSGLSRVETLEKKKLENGESQLNQYRTLGLVACGTYGKVFKAENESGELVAVKVYNKRLLKARWVSKSKNALGQVLDEIELVRTLKHPSVVKILEIIEQPFYHKFYVVQEYLNGGSLDRKLPVNEVLAQKYFKQMIEAVQFLHVNCKIAHRDLKPENFLIDSGDNLKITGFASASKISKENVLSGTYAFMPPEAFNGGRILPDKADIWALGLTLFCMVKGKLPYLSERSQELFTEVKFGDIQIPESFSTELKELFSGIFEKNPEKRITLNDIQNSKWVVKTFV
jgi:hypothetical protein